MRAHEIKTIEDVKRWAEIHEAYSNPRHEAQLKHNEAVNLRFEKIMKKIERQDEKISVLDKRISIILAVTTVIFTIINILIKFIH